MDILKNHKNQINPVFRMLTLSLPFFQQFLHTGPARDDPPPLDLGAFLVVCLRTRGLITIKIPSPENIERTSVLVIINDPNVNLYLIFKLTSPTPNLRIIELEVQRNQTKCVNKTSIKTRRNLKICVAIAHSSGLKVV